MDYEQLRAAELAIMEDPRPLPVSIEDERDLCAADPSLAPALAKLDCWTGYCTAAAACPNCQLRWRYLRLQLHRRTHGRPIHPSEQADKTAADTSGYAIIIRHFRAKYQPTFKVATAIYASAPGFGREVRREEALAGAGIDLIDRLAQASDAPRDRYGVNRDRLPYFFKTWAPTSWVDLLNSLTAEEAADEISEPAREDFRAMVRAFFCQLVNVGYQRDKTSTEPLNVERRSLARLAGKWAKPGPWQSVRDYELWSCKDRDNRLRIALRVELFSQAQGGAELARLRGKFAELAARYDVGKPGKVKGGRVRTVELLPEFIEDLFASPLDDEGDTDGRTDGHGPYANAQGAVRPSVRPSDEANKGKGMDPIEDPITEGE